VADEQFDGDQARQYLLGLLPDEAQSRFEEAFLADENRFEAVLACEDTLVDDYVAGRLAAGDRQRFEERFLSTPGRRRRVAVAREVMAHLSGGRWPGLGRLRDAWRSWQVVVRARPALFRLAASGAVLLVFGAGIWLAAERERLRSELARVAAGQDRALARAERLEAASAARDAANRELAAQLAGERAERSARQGAEKQNRAVASFVLATGLVRGAAGSQRLLIPRAVETVELQLPVPRGERYPAYQVGIATPERVSVWGATGLTSQSVGAATVVVARVPAAVLAGDCILMLSGLGSAGPEELASFVFTVVRR
jgi:hypothetical protein